MKTISILLALVNSLLAGLLIAFFISSPDFPYVSSWWSAARVLLALLVIAIGIFTWVDNMGHVRPGLMAVCSLILVTLGAAITVWTFHRAQLTGDMEYYMIVYAGSMFVQGCALLFGMAGHEGSTSTA